ncbi:MAG: signal peptidase II [Holosporales bacterium]|jgi:signal peptidase II|nr:signal peptidase II [Holosporales bacterium]
MLKLLKRFLLFGGVTFCVVWADQQTKAWMQVFIEEQGGAFALTAYLSLVRVWNKGMSFGLLNHMDIVWLFLAFVCIAVLFFVVRTYKDSSYFLTSLYGLVTGGALGNGIDRVRDGAVFDFLDFHLGGTHFPAFNLADASISIGAVLLAIFYRKQT